MSICVSISGQIRAPEASFQNLRDAVKGQDVSFVFSVWSKVGRRSDGFVVTSQLFRMFDIDVCCSISWSWLGTRITEFCPEIFRFIEQQSAIESGISVRDLVRSYFPDAYVDVEEPDSLDLSFNEVRQDMHSLRMLYKIWRVNEIKRKIERERGSRFDYVVRMRPDFRLNYYDEEMVRRECTNKHIFVDGFIPDTVWSDDSLAIGTSAAIDVYSGVFGRSITNRSRWDYIHRDLARHLSENDISFSRYPHHGYITPDKTLTLTETIDCLKKQESTGEAWLGLQKVSLLSLEALRLTRQGNHLQAEANLASALDVCENELAQCDGVLYSTALLEGKSRNTGAAIIFLTLSAAMRDAFHIDDHWEVARRLAKLSSLLNEPLILEDPRSFFRTAAGEISRRSTFLQNLLSLSERQLGRPAEEAFSKTYYALIETGAFKDTLQKMTAPDTLLTTALRRKFNL